MTSSPLSVWVTQQLAPALKAAGFGKRGLQFTLTGTGPVTVALGFRTFQLSYDLSFHVEWRIPEFQKSIPIRVGVPPYAYDPRRGFDPNLWQFSYAEADRYAEVFLRLLNESYLPFFTKVVNVETADGVKGLYPETWRIEPPWPFGASALHLRILQGELEGIESLYDQIAAKYPTNPWVAWWRHCLDTGENVGVRA